MVFFGQLIHQRITIITIGVTSILQLPNVSFTRSAVVRGTLVVREVRKVGYRCTRSSIFKLDLSKLLQGTWESLNLYTDFVSMYFLRCVHGFNQIFRGIHLFPRLKVKCPQKTIYYIIHLYEILRTENSKQTEHRPVVSRGCGKGGNGEKLLNGYEIFF